MSLDLIPGVGGRELAYEGKMADELFLVGALVFAAIVFFKSS